MRVAGPAFVRPPLETTPVTETSEAIVSVRAVPPRSTVPEIVRLPVSVASPSVLLALKTRPLAMVWPEPEAAETVARLNVQRSRIRAPFDAAVAERISGAGDFVRPGTPMFRVVNDTVLKFIVQAPEANAPDIRKGQPLRFEVDAFPGRTFQGSVFLISPQVSAATRMFSLGALVTNTDLALKANTFARGEVVLARDVPTVLAPLDAIVTSSGFSRVFVVSNSIACARDVVVGRVRKDRQEVLRGLAPGEVVAVSGLNKLRDGAAITLRDAAP